MTETDKLIQDLKKERDLLKKQKEESLAFIEQHCIYDKHLMGYNFGLSAGKVRTLVYIMNKKEEE